MFFKLVFISLVKIVFCGQNNALAFEPSIYEEYCDSIDNSLSNFFLHKDSNIEIIKEGTPQICEIVSNILTKNRERFTVQIIDNKALKNNRRRFSAIIILDNAESFKKDFNIIFNINNFRPNGFYLIALINGSLEDSEAIFSMLWKKNYYNVNVILKTVTNLTALAFLPFSEGKCGDTSPKVINHFNETLRCKIIHSASISAVIKGAKDYQGIEIDIVNAIGQNLNFTPIHKISKSKGKIIRNGSNIVITEIFKDLHDKKIDVTSGSLQLDRTELFSETYPFLSDPLVLIIPDGPLFTPLEKLYKTFSNKVWGAILVVFIVSVLLLKLLPKNFKAFVQIPKPRNLILQIINVFLGGSLETKQLPKQSFARYSLSIFLIYALVLRTVYVGILFLYLSSDVRHNEVSGVDEMIERNFTFYAYDSMFDRIVDYKFFNRSDLI